MRYIEPDNEGRFLSRADTEDLYDRIIKLCTLGGDTSVYVDTRWVGNLRWARNRISTAGEMTDHIVRIKRTIRGADGTVVTNKLDNESLRLAIGSAEEKMRYEREDLDYIRPTPHQPYLEPDLWSQSTFDLNAIKRSEAARLLVSPARDAKLLAAGYLEVSAFTRAVFNTRGMHAYYVSTRSEYSVTVRNPYGTASGWAGMDHVDWSKIDAAALSEKAMEKCIASVDPKAIEPGRYVTILEPQAVHDIFQMVVASLDRSSAEAGGSVFSDSRGMSRLGKVVFDERITVKSDPMDPDCGYIPFNGEGYAFKPVTWIENGVLKELAYDRSYALQMLGHGIAQPNSYSYHMNGGTTSLEEMISTTRRGLLVTRFDGVGIVDYSSLLCNGLSRDGLWLIENGKIKLPAKNMRFNESPMFAFNNVEQIGPAVRVYGYAPAITPSVKVRDFNFTSLSDAI